MLKYKIKGYNVKVNWEPFNLDEMYLSPKLDFLSGTTDISTSIYQGSKVVLRKKDDDSFSRKMTAEVTDVTRTGHVVYQNKLKEKTVYTSYVNEVGEIVNVTRNYVIYRDTVYFRNETNTTTQEFGESGYINGYFIEGAYYTVNSDGYVYVNTKSYIEDGKVAIGERVFTPFKVPVLDSSNVYVDTWVLKYDDESVTLSQVNDKDYTITIYDTPVRVQKVILRSKGNEPIDIEKITCGSYTSYVEYGNNNYEIVIRNNDSGNAEYGAYIPDEDGNTIFVKANYDDPLPTQEEFALTVTSMTINNVEYPVSSTLTETSDGYFVIINTVQENTYDEGSLLYVRSRSAYDKQIEVIQDGDNMYAELYGNRYYAVAHDYDVVNINGTEYRLHYTDSSFTKAYIIVDGVRNQMTIDGNVAKYDEPMFLRVNSGDSAMTDYISQSWVGASTYITAEYGADTPWESGYTVTSGYGITIEDEIYEVKIGFSDMTYIDVPTNEEYILRVQRIIGSNMLLCRPKTYNSLYPVTTDEEASTICAAIALSPDNMDFYLLDDTLGERNVTPVNCVLDTIMSKMVGGGATHTYGYQVKEPMSSLDVHGINGNLDFYREVAYHKIPVVLNSPANVGLMKEDLTTGAFVEDYTKANTNRIVDMEKMRYRMITESGGTEVMNFVIHLASGDTADMVRNILYTSRDGSIPENIKSSFFRMTFYSTDDTQTQRLLGTMCLMLGPATLPNSKMPGGLIYSANTENAGEELNLVLSYDKAVSKEGFNLYYFKEYFDGDENLEAYMRLDFNNAKTGQVVPLTWRTDKIPIKELASSMYFNMQLIYDESTTYKYGFCPSVMEGDETWVVDGDTLMLKCNIPQLMDESGLENDINENNS